LVKGLLKREKNEVFRSLRKFIGEMVEIGVSNEDILYIVHESCKFYHLVVSQIDILDDEIRKLYSKLSTISEKSDSLSTQ